MEIFDKKYDCIFSMGAFCTVAEALSKCKRRYFSSPFDWLYGGDFQTRINFLTNNFKDFLLKNNLKKIGSREEPEKTDIYINEKTDITFMHDFPKNIPLKESFSDVKQKFDKRINYLIQRIEKSKRILIIYGNGNERKGHINFDLIKNSIEKVNDYYKKKYNRYLIYMRK